MSLLNLVISSGKYSSSLSTISNVPVAENHRGEGVTSLGHLPLKIECKRLRFCTKKTNILTILAGIKAGERRSEHLHKVAHAPQVLVHVSEVSVDVIPVPEKKKRKINIGFIWNC